MFTTWWDLLPCAPSPWVSGGEGHKGRGEGGEERGERGVGEGGAPD